MSYHDSIGINRSLWAFGVVQPSDDSVAYLSNASNILPMTEMNNRTVEEMGRAVDKSDLHEWLYDAPEKPNYVNEGGLLALEECAKSIRIYPSLLMKKIYLRGSFSHSNGCPSIEHRILNVASKMS